MAYHDKGDPNATTKDLRRGREQVPEAIKRWFAELQAQGKLLPGQSLDDFVKKIRAGEKLTEFQARELTKLLGKKVDKGHIVQLNPTEFNPTGGSNSPTNMIPEIAGNDDYNALLGNRKKGTLGIDSIDLDHALRAGVPVDWMDAASNYLAGDGNLAPTTVVDKILINKGVNPDLVIAERDKIIQLTQQGVNVKQTSMIDALHTPPTNSPTPKPGVLPLTPRPGGNKVLKIVGDAYANTPAPLRKGLRILPIPAAGMLLSTGAALAADEEAKQNPTLLNKTQANFEKAALFGGALSLASTAALVPTLGTSSLGIVAGETIEGLASLGSLGIDGWKTFADHTGSTGVKAPVTIPRTTLSSVSQEKQRLLRHQRAQQSGISYEDQELYEAGGGQAKQKANRLTMEQVRVIGRKNLELQYLNSLIID